MSRDIFFKQHIITILLQNLVQMYTIQLNLKKTFVLFAKKSDQADDFIKN